MANVKKVVLAYSGGLDTSVILKWLINTYKCEVVTVTADLGQPEDLTGVEEKALKTGAVKAYVLDLREEMARDFVFPMVRAAGIYENKYLLGTSIARPLITKALIDIAHKEGADAIAHFQIGAEVVHCQQIEVKTFVLHMVGVFNQVSEQEEGSLVCDVSPDIVVGGVVPLSVQGLEHAADFVVPAFRQVAFPEVGEIHEVGFFLVGE